MQDFYFLSNKTKATWYGLLVKQLQHTTDVALTKLHIGVCWILPEPENTYFRNLIRPQQQCLPCLRVARNCSKPNKLKLLWCLWNWEPVCDVFVIKYFLSRNTDVPKRQIVTQLVKNCLGNEQKLTVFISVSCLFSSNWFKSLIRPQRC